MKKTSEMSKDSPLERYMTVLETIAPFADGLTAAELEAALDLPKTTVNRLLNVLVGSGMVSSQNTRNRTFSLGNRVLKLIQASPDSGWLPLLAERPLQELADKTAQSAFISRLDGKDIRSVTCVAPDTPVRTYVMPGMAMPINAAASAKAILAFQQAGQLEGMLAAGLERFTENTITTRDRFLAELAATREQGYALDRAEHVPGLGSIAYPIRVPGAEVIYSVGVTGPIGQVLEQGFDSHSAAIRHTAAQLGKLLEMRASRT
ncbi:IclR family transcriptional regulator [Rhizobium sp.]